jgi:hypothetical protein
MLLFFKGNLNILIHIYDLSSFSNGSLLFFRIFYFYNKNRLINEIGSGMDGNEHGEIKSYKKL